MLEIKYPETQLQKLHDNTCIFHTDLHYICSYCSQALTTVYAIKGIAKLLVK
jgi:hypothetical protein